MEDYERAYARKQAAQLDVQNAMLRGGLPAIVELVATLRDQNSEADTLRRDRETIYIMREVAIAQYWQNATGLQGLIESLNQLLGEHKKHPVIIDMVGIMLQRIEALKNKSLINNREAVASRHGDIAGVLAEIFELGVLCGVYSNGMGLYDIANHIALHPPFVAYNIARELEETGEPLLRWFEYLWEWINENIDKPPSKVATFREGVIVAYRYKQSGKTQRQFSSEGYSDRQVRTWVGWLESIQDLATSG